MQLPVTIPTESNEIAERIDLRDSSLRRKVRDCSDVSYLEMLIVPTRATSLREPRPAVELSGNSSYPSVDLVACSYLELHKSNHRPVNKASITAIADRASRSNRDVAVLTEALLTLTFRSSPIIERGSTRLRAKLGVSS